MYALAEFLSLDEQFIKQTQESIVALYVLEGKSLSEAKKLAETTITPDVIKDIDKNPDYRKINKELDFAGNLIDDVWHRDPLFAEEFLTDVKGSFEKEAEVCDAVADFIGSARLKGFDREVVRQAMPDAAKSYQFLKNRAARLRKDIANMDVTVYDASTVDPNTGEKEYKINSKVSRKPGEAVRDALKALSAFLKGLGMKDWDYDYFLTHGRSVNSGKEIIGTAEFDKEGIRATVDCAISEGIYDKRALLGLAESLELSGDAKEYLEKYVYYILD